MPLLTPKQAAEELAISVRQLLYLTDDGELPFINIGRGQRTMRRYDPSDILAFINRRKVTKSHPSSTAQTRKRAAPAAPHFHVVDFNEVRKNLRKRKASARTRSREIDKP